MIKQFKLFQSGYCTHREFVTIRGGSYKKVKYPANFAYMKHELHGNILYDTGYSAEFYRATKKFPFNLYAALTPVFLEPHEEALSLLEAEGIAADDIDYIILSHFHADHIAGIKPFTRAKILYHSVAYDALQGLSVLGELKRGFLKTLLPEDFDRRSMGFDFSETMDVSDRIGPFLEGYDVFGDQSIVLIELEGHAKGQVGLLIQHPDGGDVLMIADAAWSSRAYQELVHPLPLAYWIMDCAQGYNETLKKLNALHLSKPSVRIIPSHCELFHKEL